MKHIGTLSPARVIELIDERQPAPTRTEVVCDWPLLYARIEQKGHAVLACTRAEYQSFYQWMKKHKNSSLAFQNIASGTYLITFKEK